MFRVRPSNFLSSSFWLFQSVLPTCLSKTFPFLGFSPFPSQSFSFLESDLPIFSVSPSHCSNSLLLIFRARPSHFFWISPSHFSSLTFPFFQSVPPTFPSQPFSFFDPDLPIFTGQSFQPFGITPSHFLAQTFRFLRVSPSTFRNHPFSFFKPGLLIFGGGQSFSFSEPDLPIFFGSVLPTFPSQSFSFFKLDLLPIFFTLSFRLLPVLCSDLIDMCTVDKIKEAGVCRKRLHCTTNSLSRETNQKKLTDKQEKIN